MKLPPKTLFAMLALASLALFPRAAVAQDTWTGGSGSWNATSNWQGGIVPGVSGTPANNGDNAYFSQGSGTVGVDANGRNLGAIIFDAGAGSYTITGGTLYLSSDGVTGIASTFTGTNTTEIIGSSIIFGGTNKNTAFSYTFSNQSADPSNTLVLAGNVTTSADAYGLNMISLVGTGIISGSITDGNALVGVNDYGSWTLSGTNTYSAQTNIYGTMNLSGVLGGTNSFNNSIITVNNGAYFNETSTGVISGSESLVLVGGTAQLSGSNNLLGGVTIGSNFNSPPYAMLLLGSKAALGSGTLFLQTGTVAASTDLGGANALTGNIMLHSVTAVGSASIGGTNNFTFAGNFTNFNGSNELTIANTGTTDFSGNVYLSDRPYFDGTLIIAGPGNLVIDGTIADFAGSGTGQAGVLKYQGSGTLTLSGSNASNGSIQVNSGALVLGSNTALGNASLSISGSPLVLANGVNTLSNPITTSGSVSISGASNLIIGGAFTPFGALLLNSDNTTFLNPLYGTVSLYGAGNINLTQGYIVNESFGAGSMSYNGSGTITVSGTQNSGDFSVNSGNVVLTGSQLGNIELFFVNGGTFSQSSSGVSKDVELQVNGGMAILSGSNGLDSGFSSGMYVASGTLRLNGGIINEDGIYIGGGAGPALFTEDAAGNILGGVNPIGNVSIQVNAGGSAILSGSNSYTGNTVVGGSMGLQGGGSITNSPVIVNSGGIFTEDALSSISGSTGVTVNAGGYAVLSGSVLYTGATSISGTLQLNTAMSAPVVVGSGGSGLLIEAATASITGSGTLLTVNAGGTATLSGSNNFTGTTPISGVLNLNGGSLNNSPVSVNTGGSLTEDGYGAINGSVPLNINAGGSASLSGSNTYTGTTFVRAGGLTLDFSRASAPASAANIVNNSVNSSALLLQGGTLNVMGGGSGAVNSQVFNGAYLNSGSGQSSIGVSGNGSSAVLLALGALNTSGTGATVDFTLPGGAQNAANGITTSSTNWTSNNLLVNSQGVAFATAGRTDWAGLGLPMGGVANIVPLSSIPGGYSPTTGTPGVDFSSGTANVDVIQNETAPDASGSINSLRFNVDGATLALQGGTTTILSGGILVTKNVVNGALLTGGAIQSGTGGMIVLINQGNFAMNSGIVGTGTLVLVGPGSTALAGNSTFSGGIVLSTGTLDINGAGAPGRGTLSIFGGTIDNTSGSAVAVTSNNKQAWYSGILFAGSNPLDMGSGTIAMVGTSGGVGNIYVGGSSLTLNGVITGSANLVKNGPGTLVLGGTDTYTGTTTINSGTLQLNENQTTPTLVSAQAQSVTMGTGTTGGVTLVVAGNSSVSTTQYLQFVRLNRGANSIIVTPSGATTTTLVLAGLLRSVGATLNVTESPGHGTSVQGFATLTNGILPYATVSDGTATGFATIVTGSYLRYTTATALTPSSVSGTINYSLSNGNLMLSASESINSLSLNAMTSSVQLNLNQHMVSLTSGGVLATGTRAATIASGTLTSATGELIVQQYSTGTFSISSALTGTMSVTKAGPGILALNNGNTYTGNTYVNAGTMDINTGGLSSSIGTGTLVMDGGNLDSTSSGVSLSTANPQLWESDFTFFGTKSLNLGVGAVNIAGNGAMRMVTVNSSTMTVGGIISGNGYGLAKGGAGTLVLSASEAYTGPTLVNSGTLRINGSIVSSSGVTTSSSATLAGSGIAGKINGAGTVAPGGSKILTASQVDPSGGIDFAFHFSQTGAPDYSSPTASINDLLHLTGATPFTIALGSGNVITLDFTGLALEAGQTFYGGIFADSALADSMLNGATFNFTGLNGATMQYDGLAPVSEADFATGTVTNGEVMKFEVAQPVPAAPAWALALTGAGLLLAARRRVSS